MITTVDDLFELVKKNFNMLDLTVVEGCDGIQIYKNKDLIAYSKAVGDKEITNIHKVRHITLCFRDFTNVEFYSVDEFVGHNTLSLGYIGEKSTGYSLICDEVDISNEIVDFIKEHLF